jgi:hypothetical protein
MEAGGDRFYGGGHGSRRSIDRAGPLTDRVLT